jgi:hypothetical protein
MDEIMQKASTTDNVTGEAKQLSLGLHRDQLATSSPSLLSAVCVLKPQNIGDQCRISQQQKF